MNMFIFFFYICIYLTYLKSFTYIYYVVFLYTNLYEIPLTDFWAHLNILEYPDTQGHFSTLTFEIQAA